MAGSTTISIDYINTYAGMGDRILYSVGEGFKVAKIYGSHYRSVGSPGVYELYTGNRSVSLEYAGSPVSARFRLAEYDSSPLFVGVDTPPMLSSVYALLPSNTSAIAGEMTVSVKYDRELAESLGLDPSQIALYYYDRTSDSSRRLQSLVSVGNGVVYSILKPDMFSSEPKGDIMFLVSYGASSGNITTVTKTNTLYSTETITTTITSAGAGAATLTETKTVITTSSLILTTTVTEATVTEKTTETVTTTVLETTGVPVQPQLDMLPWMVAEALFVALAIAIIVLGRKK